MNKLVNNIREQIQLTNGLYSEYTELASSSAILTHHTYRLLEGDEGLCSEGWKRGYETFLAIEQPYLMELGPSAFRSALGALKRVQSSLVRLIEQEQARISREKDEAEAAMLEKSRIFFDVFGEDAGPTRA